MYRRRYNNFFQRFIIAMLSPLSIGVIGSLAFAIYSVLLGQSLFWDLLNYHYYNGFAICEGKLYQNILPAQLPTFLNPTLDVPLYLLMTYLPPVATGFILGLIQGLNFVLIYILARQILSNTYIASINSILQSLVALMIAIIGVTAPMFMSEIGTASWDNITSILVLAALILVLRKPTHKTPINALLGGLLIGAAVGLKLTNGIFVLALVCCGWWYERRLKRCIVTIGLFLLGTCFGFLLLHGWWSWYLFQEYQNPLFPFFNGFFKSPYFAPINWTYWGRVPHSFYDALSYPFQWATTGVQRTCELAFRDLRFAILSILFFITLIITGTRIFIHHIYPVRSNKLDLIMFFIISYCIWLVVISAQRYIVVLELLTGLITVLLIETIIKIRRYIILAGIIAAVVLVATTQAPDWGRAPWNSTWFDTKVPVELTINNQMFIMLGNEPISYLIPSFPPDAQFVRIVNNFSLAPKMDERIRQTINTQRGPIYSFKHLELNDQEIKLLQSYGLKRSSGECIQLNSKAYPGTITICPLNRIVMSEEPKK